MSYRSASARARVFEQALREAMSPTVTDAIQPEGPPAADPAAGTPRTEGVTPYNVARENIIPKPGLHPDDGNRVEHERQAKLRRWQAVDPRERRG